MSRASAQWSCVRIVEDGEVSRWQTPFAALPSMRSLAVRRVLRQAWELDDDDKAEKLIRNLAQRLGRSPARSWKASRRFLPSLGLDCRKGLRRSHACTDIIENVMGTVRRVCRNVKRWRSAFMALRRGPQALCRKRSKASDDWRLTINFERYVLLWKHARQTTRPAVSLLAKPTPLNINFGSDRFGMFNKQRDISPKWKEYSLYCS
jgi:hypothetical protein